MANLPFSKQQYLTWYADMQLMRRFEERAGQLYIQQKIRGFCHLYIGQEAIAAGAMSTISKDDNVITAYRDHVHPFIKGVEPKYVMAELYGKATGVSKGKGGSMHMFSKEHRVFGGHGIVGGQIPLGAGIAFAEQYQGTKNVTLCYMGDGAVRQGALHEAFNMAMLWKLPVIFIIENNNYAMGTSVERSSNVTQLYTLGESYDMPAAPVNAMSVEEVHFAMEKAVAHVKEGNGPYLLEMETYRYRGHSMSDPAKYRTKEEVEEYKAQDPIQRVLKTILDNQFATEAEMEALNERINADVEAAIEFAENSPFPDDSELYTDVYIEPNYPFIKD